MCYGRAIEAPEPRLFPEDQTSRLASVMGRPIAPDVLQVDAVLHLSAADPQRRIARLMGPFAHAQRHSAILKHLRHEWQFIDPALVVQRAENLLLRPYLHPFPGAEPGAGRNRVVDALHQVGIRLSRELAIIGFDASGFA